jgi:hypothetical protein
MAPPPVTAGHSPTAPAVAAAPALQDSGLIAERRNRIFNRDHIQRLREQRISTPNFATKLLLFFFDTNEFQGNVNVEGNIHGRNVARNALDNVRIDEIRKLVTDGKINDKDKKLTWSRCRDAMNKKISEIKKSNNF